MFTFIPANKKKTDIPPDLFVPVDKQLVVNETRKIFNRLGIPEEKVNEYHVIGYDIGDDDAIPLFENDSKPGELFELWHE